MTLLDENTYLDKTYYLFFNQVDSNKKYIYVQYNLTLILWNESDDKPYTY